MGVPLPACPGVALHIPRQAQRRIAGQAGRRDLRGWDKFRLGVGRRSREGGCLRRRGRRRQLHRRGRVVFAVPFLVRGSRLPISRRGLVSLAAAGVRSLRRGSALVGRRVGFGLKILRSGGEVAGVVLVLSVGRALGRVLVARRRVARGRRTGRSQVVLERRG